MLPSVMGEPGTRRPVRGGARSGGLGNGQGVTVWRNTASGQRRRMAIEPVATPSVGRPCPAGGASDPALTEVSGAILWSSRATNGAVGDLGDQGDCFALPFFFTYPLVFVWSVRKGPLSPLLPFASRGFRPSVNHALREIDRWIAPAGGSRHPIGRPVSAPLTVLPSALELIDTPTPLALQAASPTVRTRLGLSSAIERDSNGTQRNEHA